MKWFFSEGTGYQSIYRLAVMHQSQTIEHIKAVYDMYMICIKLYVDNQSSEKKGLETLQKNILNFC